MLPEPTILLQNSERGGKLSCLGGVHPTILPREAAPYADSVVIGEVEDIWEALLEDFQAGKLKKFYQKEPPNLERYIPAKNKKKKRGGPFNVLPIMTTRGCPFNCEFCSVTNIYGRKIRHVPIENVIRQIEESEGKKYMFLDDNIIGHPKYAQALFKAIKPLNIKWVGQATVSFASETELMKLAAESGCIALFFGVESVSETQLKRMKKSASEVMKIEEAVKRIMDFGIHFHASVFIPLHYGGWAHYANRVGKRNRCHIVANFSYNIEYFFIIWQDAK
jgi:radical SAM superfamily enzyme YgiQ (UPF0313 family)